MSEENARLYEAAQRRLREITTLYEASQVCFSISDQKGLLTAIIEAAARATDAALGSVMLIDEEKGEYIFGAHYGLSQEAIAAVEAELHIPLGEGLVGSVVTTGQPLVLADVTTDPRWVPMEATESMHSFLGVPLIGREGQVLGALTLSRPEVDAFDEDHARLLSTFANQAAVAIENARLYEQAQQEIAERKRAEEALRESAERYRSIFENAPVSIWTCDGEGTITFANQAALDLFGVTDPTQTIGRYNVYRDMTETEKPLLAYFERAWAGEVVRYRQDLDMTTVKYDTARRETLHFYSTVFPVPASGGQRPSIVVMQEDITERVRAEEALRVSEERFALAVQGANDGIWDWDIQSNSLYWSPRLKELLGYADDELDVDFDTFDSLLHPDDKERVAAAIEAHLKDRVLYDVEQRLRTKSGEYRWFRARGQALWDEAGNPVRMVGSTTDITERKQAEAERERLLAEMENLAKELAVLNELGQALTARLSVEEVLDEGYRQASRLVDTTNFYIALCDPEKDEITFPYTMDSEENDWSPLKRGKGLTGRIIETRKPMLLPTGATGFHRETGGEIQYDEIGKPALSWLGVPLVIGDRVLGVMAVQSYTTSGLYDEHDRDLLTAIASPTAIAIQNARLFEDTKSRLAQLTALQETTRAVASTLELDKLLNLITQQATTLLQGDGGIINLVNWENKEEEVVVASGSVASALGWHNPLEDSLSGWVALHNQPVISNQLQSDDRVDPRMRSGEVRVQSAAIAPLTIKDQVIGTLVVMDKQGGKGEFDQADLGFLIAFANQAATAIQNARLFEETQARTEEMAALREVNLATLSTLERDQVFEIMLDQLGKVIDHDNAAIKIITPDGIDKMIAGRGPVIYDQAMWDGFDVKDSRLVQEMRETGRTVVVHDVHTDERYARVGDWEALHSWVGAPLFVRGDFIGYLMVEKTSLGFYDEHAAQLLSDFAHAAAIALENARLYEDIRRERDYSQTLIATANALVVGLDLEGRITLFNDFCAEITGYSQEEVLGRDWFTTLLPERERLPTKRVFHEVMEQGLPSQRESLILTKDGRERVIAWSNTLIRDAEGRPASALAIGQDVTERKKAEEELRQLKEFNEGIVQSMTEGITVDDVEGYFTFINPAAAALLGYLPEELLGQPWTVIVPPDQQPIIQAAHERRVRGEADRYEIELIRRDGTRVPVMISGSPRFEEGRFVGTLGVFTDITERRRAEESLRESEERYRALYEDNPSMYFTVDTEGTVLSVNQFGAEQLGYTVEELVGQSVLNVFYKDDKKAVLQQLTMCLQNPTQIARWEFRKVRKDGSVLWVKEAARAVQDIDGNTVVLVVCEDITERKKLEEQLRQAQKMDAIGTLAGGIAHDFNNLLTPIGGFAELLLWKAPEGSQQHEYLRQIKVAAERAAALTGRLLTFARRDRVEVHPLSLNDVVREVIGLLGRTIDKAIAIESYLADDLATVEGDASQLHQMLLNLCLNARDAMPDGGRLIIETQNMTLSKAKARTDLDLEAGQYVLLSVTDTGSGMDAEIRQHLFEPFFTTKEQGRGLGLAMTYGIVRGHGGIIHVYSEPGQGSTFKVYLPVAGRLVVSTVPQEAEVVGGTETVLVVDDEGSVRELLRHILEEGGYTVLLATDGVEAVELYSRLGAEIDLVVLDIIMPRMGGRKTYERLREINPEVKVLLSSGYSENGQARDILAAGARDFLQKPYDLRAVLRKVRDVLDG